MHTLQEAHRRIIEAIEVPPDTGEEPRLDDLAATLWAHTQRERSLDPGARCRVRYGLRAIADNTHEDRARHLRRARELLDAYAEQPTRHA